MSMRKTFLALLLCRQRDAPRFAQEKTFELKTSHWVPASHSAAKGAGRLGRRGRKGIRRHHQPYKVYPAQQPARHSTLRLARRWHCRRHLRQPGLSARRFPRSSAGAGGKLPFLSRNATGGSEALDAWYRKYAGTR